MGDDNDEVEFGADCALCFAPGETPAAMAITVSGVEFDDGWEDCNGTYLCVQDGGGACKYLGTLKKNGWSFYMVFELRNPFSFCSITTDATPNVFSGLGSGPCALSISNIFNPWDGPYYYGSLSASPAGPQSFWNYHGGLFPVDNALLETTSENDDMKCIRTVNTPDKTNFLIKIEK